MERRAILYNIAPGVTCIDDTHESTCYVVCGTERAAVIDTVNGKENLYDVVREITDLPLVVIDTHGHPDHILGNGYFEEAYIHPADVGIHDEFFARSEQKPCKLKPIEAGEVIDLGGRELEVILVAGHTHGSICLLDRTAGFLYSGDAINGQLWMQLPHSTKLSAYLDSLNALDKYRADFQYLRTGHNVENIDAKYIDEMKAAITEIIETKGESDEDFTSLFGSCKRHMMRENTWVLYTVDKL